MHVALVTGSTRTIGKAIALRLAADGAGVVVNSRDEAATDAVAEEIRAAGRTAIGHACDVTDRAAVRAMTDAVTAELGPIDILVNNAVIRCHAPIEETSSEDWRRTLSVVLDGAFHCSQAVLPGMRDRGWGRVVNLAGVSGQSGGVNCVAVATAKSGIIGLTRSVAMEFAADGITCNAISPGPIDTARDAPRGQAGLAEAHHAKQGARVPVGRLGRPEDVAAMCAHLCSDEAGFITGQTVGINGGIYF
jgi:NAD(P)-dependent dehydrogenase (short-subunit alcohol dehydrogenase family)